ncbi:hypothetical protein [Raoultibacter timonensis]|uniref:hypothetical protein n=1 Tax=Raoultibacter timonensis TaxID=1907662 RepID=UPI0015E190C3|nr:hypothetical protein [Raoultibacter timonensis]
MASESKYHTTAAANAMPATNAMKNKLISAKPAPERQPTIMGANQPCKPEKNGRTGSTDAAIINTAPIAYSSRFRSTNLCMPKRARTTAKVPKKQSEQNTVESVADPTDWFPW